MKKIHQEINSYKGIVNKPQLSWESSGKDEKPKLANPTMMVNKAKNTNKATQSTFIL
jgi:hypothetical protein